MRRRRSHLGAVALAFLLAVSVTGCDRRLEAPPIEVLQRPSLLGAGTIVQIKSTTNEVLTDIEVTISSGDRTMTYTELRLAGYDTVEIGWKKLGGWEIPDDAKVEVTASGYLLPARARLVPETQAGTAPEDGGQP